MLTLIVQYINKHHAFTRPLPEYMEAEMLNDKAILNRINNGCYKHPEIGKVWFVCLGKGSHSFAVRIKNLPKKLQKPVSMTIDAIYGMKGH